MGTSRIASSASGVLGGWRLTLGIIAESGGTMAALGR